MISFLQPLALFALAGAAIPALLHLLQRREPPTVIFPAVRYLSQTEREHSRRLKLRNLLLLLLRTLIIIFIVLAAARPVADVAMGSVHAPTAVAVIVDNSLSSGAVVSGTRALEELVERARRVIERVGESDRLWLMLADGIPRRVSKIEAAATLDSIAPWPTRLDLGDAVRTASSAIEEDPLPGHEVVVLSDLQASAFSSGPAPSARVVAVLPSARPANRGVTSARVEPTVWRPDGSVIASVDGVGDLPTAVRLSLDGQDMSQSVVAPGERVALHASPATRGWYAASVSLDPDEMRSDDQWRLAVRVAEPAAVRAGPGAGRFVREGLKVLQESGRIGTGDLVRIADDLAPARTALLPPADPALLGGINRALAARGVSWRFGELLSGEWQAAGEVGPAVGAAIYRRYRLTGSGVVLARAGADPWIVRDGEIVIVASRMDLTWTELPVTAGFIPFLDLLTNGLATSGSSIVRSTPGAVVEVPPSARTLHGLTGSSPVPPDRRMTAPLQPGVYFMSAATGDTIGALEVNHDPRESMLEPTDRRSLQATFGPGADLVAEDELEEELFRGAKRADLSTLLVAAAVLTALAELAVASAGGHLERRA